MKTRSALYPVLLSAALALAGCASAPVHYYTLQVPAPQAQAQTAPSTAAPYLLDVLPVGIPEALNRQALVVRQGEAGLAVLDRERWAGPLDEEIRAALSARLSERLGARDVTGLAPAAKQPVLRVKVEIRRLDAWPGQRVDLDADWSVGLADAPERRAVCRSRLSQPAPGGSAALVVAHQRLVDALAQRIATTAQGGAGHAWGDCRTSTGSPR